MAPVIIIGFFLDDDARTALFAVMAYQTTLLAIVNHVGSYQRRLDDLRFRSAHSQIQLLRLRVAQLQGSEVDPAAIDRLEAEMDDISTESFALDEDLARINEPLSRPSVDWVTAAGTWALVVATMALVVISLLTDAR